MKLLSLTLFSAALAAAKQDKCYALALSGGANNGAWEAGVMWGLAHYGDPDKYAWDVVTGVSAGAVNTAVAAMWAPNDLVKFTEWYSDVVANTATHEIWKNWRLGPLWGLIDKSSLVDDSPMFTYFDEQLKDLGEIKRRFTIAAVDVGTGEYVTFNQTNTDKDSIAQAAISSSSIPGAFPPQHFADHILMDGGTVWDINVSSAINQCLEIVDDPSDIVLDIMICGYDDGPDPVKHTWDWNTIRYKMRENSWQSFYSGSNSIQEAKELFPTVDYRHLFM